MSIRLYSFVVSSNAKHPRSRVRHPRWNHAGARRRGGGHRGWLAIRRNTTIIKDDVVASIRALKASAGKTIVTDGSSQLVHTLRENDLVDELFLQVYPVALGSGKRVFPASGLDRKFTIVKSTSYPTGVVGLHYKR